MLDDAGGWVWTGWLAFAALEPFGPLRDDLRAGTTAAAAGSAWGGRFRPADFFDSLRAGGLADARAAMIATCPALTLTPLG